VQRLGFVKFGPVLLLGRSPCSGGVVGPGKSEFDLPPVETASDITKAFCMIAKAMAAGELTPDEAGTVATVVEAHRKAIETAEFEERLRKSVQLYIVYWSDDASVAAANELMRKRRCTPVPRSGVGLKNGHSRC
jgi:hypothetical protein